MPDLLTVLPDGAPLCSWLFDGVKSPYQHTFGGPARHKGVVYYGCPKPLHLLYNIDLNDPNVRLQLTGIQWLPFYNAMQYDSSPVQYRVLSNNEIQIVYQERTVWTPHFPYEGYPEHFPLMDVTVRAPEEILLEDEVLDHWENQWDDIPDRDPNPNELCALEVGFSYGPARTECRNCGHSDMNMLGAFQGEFIEGVSIWGGAERVIIVYKICPKCCTIDATNWVN